MPPNYNPYSTKLFWILFLAAALLMCGFTATRYAIGEKQHLTELETKADNIAHRVSHAITPSIWDIYRRSENREFSNEVASALLDSEFRDPYLIGIVVYGNFGHIFSGKLRVGGIPVDFTKSRHNEIQEQASNSIIIPVKNGPMTIGNIRVYLTSDPYTSARRQQLALEIIQTFTVSFVFVTVLFIILRKTLITPMKSLAIAKHAIESLNEAVVVSDKDGTIIDANSCYCQLFGTCKNKLIGTSINLKFAPNSPTAELWNIWLHKTEQRNWSGNLQIEIRKNRYNHFFLKSSPVLSNGRETEDTVTVLQDIEDLKVAEQELKRYNSELETAKIRAEKSSKAKDDFLSVMSHELRTPLNPILGFGTLVKNELNDPSLIDKVDVIIKSSKHLLSIIESILNYTKLERAKASISSEYFDYQDVCNNAGKTFSFPAAEKGLKLTFNHNVRFNGEQRVAAPILIETDKTIFSQIILNLFGNAVKYTDKGKVELNSTLTKTENGYSIRIEVSDTGIGIDDANRESIFRAFTQVDASLNRKHEGVGLGLAITKKLVEVLDGTIDFTSQRHAGSTFWVEIPISNIRRIEDQPSVQTPPRISNSGWEIRILVVEDERSNRELAATILEKRGYKVQLATNGQEAIELAKQECFDLILMDLQLPGVNGFDAAEYIRKNVAMNQDTPIIAVTAHASMITRQECLNSGMNDFIGKPYEPDDLNQHIEPFLPRS